MVAAEVTNEPDDKRQLAPMVAQIQAEAGELPEHVISDNGYCSDEQLAALSGRMDAYVATKSERTVYKGSRGRQAEEGARRRHAGGVHGTKTSHEVKPFDVRQAEGYRGACIRADQVRTGLPAISAPRAGKCCPRMETDLCHP